MSKFWLAALLVLTILAAGCLSITPTGPGKGNINGGGIDCHWNGFIASGTCQLTDPDVRPSTVAADPDDGSYIESWSGCDLVSPDGTTCTPHYYDLKFVCWPPGCSWIPIPVQNPNVQVRFTTGSPTLTVVPQWPGSGDITGGGLDCHWDGTIASGTCSVIFPDSTSTIDVTATPEAGSYLYYFGGCDSVVGNVCTVTGASNRTVTASFSLDGQ